MTLTGSRSDFDVVRELIAPAGAISGNLAAFTNSSQRRGGLLELLESVSLAVSRDRALEFNDAALFCRYHRPAPVHWLSPTFQLAHRHVEVPGTSSTSDLWSNLSDYLQQLLSETGVSDDSVVFEANPQMVDWERIKKLRGAWARESDDLYEWYAQQEE